MHRQNIEHIIEHGTTAQMIELKDVLVDTIDYLKTTDYDRYVCAEYEITKIAYGGHLSESIAKCWVSKMQNKDGTIGEHWTMEQIKTLLHEKGSQCHLYDMYAVMNMIYSDHYNTKFDVNIYYDMAKDWLNDKDVTKCKLLKYYYFIVK